jgi:hypothetical protein
MKKFAALAAIVGVAVATAVAVNNNATDTPVNSGLAKGERVVPFHPTHIIGPLKGTDNCFPCTFQNRPQVQIWVNGDSFETVNKFAAALDSAMDTYKDKEFKAMIVYLAPEKEHKKLGETITKTAAEKKFANVDISLLDPKNDAIKHYKVNTDASVKNTVFVYRDWKVVEKMVNLKADEEGLKSLSAAIKDVVSK